MPLHEKHHRADIRLLRNLEHQDSGHRGGDLFVVKDPRQGRVGDLETLGGVENLKQALLLRFLTPRGEMAALGHPDYGSSLYTLVGEQNNDTNRNRAKLYALQTLAGEPRVKEVLNLTVTPDPAHDDRINIRMFLQIAGSEAPLHLVFSFSFAGGGVIR